MKFGSLFAGIGGFDLGLERAGMECAWQVEIDPFCSRVLAKHWPHVERYGDVRDCGKHNLAPVDLICGGFPCQPHSVAGKRRGAEDDRDLWPEYRRIVAELRPRWVVAENVPGIRNTILDQVLSDLERMDYEVGAVVVPACAVDAPHRRERIWIVGHASQVRLHRNNGRWSKSELANRCPNMANATGARWNGTEGQGQYVQRQSLLSSRPINGGDVADATSQRSTYNCESQARGAIAGRDTIGSSGLRQPTDCHAAGWLPEPNVGRVAHGVPRRVDRLRALGNAVVPQVAEWLGRRILEVDGEIR